MKSRVKYGPGRSKKGNVSTAAVTVMSALVLSRMTGFLRETMLSWKIGLSWAHDAYAAALAVPDLVYFLLVGGTISAALVPHLSGKIEKGEEADGWNAAGSFINAIMLATLMICVSGVVFAPAVIPAVAPGFSEYSPQTRELAVILARILFTSVFFIMAAGILSGVLNSYRKFAAAAFGPSIYNAGCALSICLFAGNNRESMVRTAVGVAASAFVYFLIQLAFARAKLKYYRLAFNVRDAGFRELVGQALPSMLSSSMAHVNLLVSAAFVSMCAQEGALAAFRNANTLWQLPYGIFAMGIGTAILPELSGRFATGSIKEYRSLMTKSLTSVLFFAIPSAAGFIVLREPIVRAVFKWGGEFPESGVPKVASILALFSISMIFQSIAAIMNRAFYAGRDARTPLMAGIGSVVLNFFLCLAVYSFTGLGAPGMALSYSITGIAGSTLLLALKSGKNDGIEAGKLAKFVLKSVPAALAMSAALLLMTGIPVRTDSKLLELAWLAVLVASGSAVYIAAMFFMKAEELVDLVNRINMKKQRENRL